jgi:hypothetical protein
MVAHWADYADPGYLSFIEEARPEVAQIGFYGAHFWSLADTPFGGGYPAHFPVRGHRECGDWFARLNTELHRRGVKVIGHINVKFLVGDPEGPEGPRGFFRFYRDQWDEKLLGAKPVSDPLELLEQDRFGKPISNQDYGIGGMREYWACLNNPHWRQVLKAWVRFGIAKGVDGFIANYFYRHDCHCPYCVSGFRQYLRTRFTAAELKQRFAVTNLDTHQFDEIVAWHDPGQSTPLRREMLRFSQIANKEAFDDVFVQFGRSIKPDLIVAQWNHLGDFNQISGDERCLLPDELWGRDEDYLWYSTGDAANFTDLASGVLGEATLQARYIRGAFDDKPFTLGKYESTRIRVSIAELAANGGAPMGFYTNFKDPDARLELVRYYSFLRRNETLYRANRSHAEVLLLFPRSRVHEGDVTVVGRFRELGKRLLDGHVLFDVLPDDRATNLPPSHRTGSVLPLDGRVIRREGEGSGVKLEPLNRSSRREEARYAKAKDQSLLTSAATSFIEHEMHFLTVIDPSDARVVATKVMEKIPLGLSRFEAPATVRVSASRPGSEPDVHVNEITLHFVNYNREEPADKRSGSGIRDEKPITAPPCQVDFKLPTNFPSPDPAAAGPPPPRRAGRGQREGRVRRVEFLTPEAEQARELEFKQIGTRLRFRVPEFLVYGVVRIELSKSE